MADNEGGGEVIKIGDDYEIDTDKYQYILSTRRLGKDKDGNEKYSWDKTFHPNIQQCCNAIADEELRHAVQSGIVYGFNGAIDRLVSAVSVAEEAGK